MAGDTNVGAALGSCQVTLRQAHEDGRIASLPSHQFRTIIGLIQKGSGAAPSVAELAETLLVVLAECSMSVEAQCLASTALALALALTHEPRNIALMFSKQFLPASAHEPFHVKLSKLTGGSGLKLEVAEPQSFKLSLIHGLLQLDDTFWSSQQVNWHELMCVKVLPVIESGAAGGSTVALRCLGGWVRRVGRVPPDMALRVAAALWASWESPARDCVSSAFDRLLDSTASSEDAPAYLKPHALLQLVLAEMSWMMKSKYFLLGPLLNKCGVLKTVLRWSDDIVSGLVTSLAYTHLAPAGADLYRTCLEALKLEHWTQLFLQPILRVLISSPYTLQKQNVFNYWMPATVKKFRGCLSLLEEGLAGADSGDLLLAGVNLARLGGSTTWLLAGLTSAEPLVRAHAFGSLCKPSPLPAAPSDAEFDLVEEFLADNLNTDDTALRHSTATHLAAFLARVRDASLQVLKTKYQTEGSHFENRALTRSMVFLERLFNLVKGGLEAGSNYQRKVSSLELFRLAASIFCAEPPTEATTRKRASDGTKVMKYALAVGKWSFTSEAAREMLVHCVADSSEDVREAAAHILTTYFKFNDSDRVRGGELYRRGLVLCGDPLFYHAAAGAALVVVGLRCGGGGVEALLAAAEVSAARLRTDLLEAAARGAPTHALLSALARLLPEVVPFASRILSLIESLSAHLVNVLKAKSPDITEFAPSFSEMGEAIASAVGESSLSVEESDPFQLSPAHQLILNCVWLNLRACCKLASGLVTQVEGLSEGDMERCLSVCAAVVVGCRHKGALEVGATSVKEIAREIVTRGGGTTVLSSRLATLLSSPQSAPTQSTRAAGAVALAHAIITSDPRPNKPLVREWSRTLLSEIESPGEGTDLARTMHLVSLLVRDSSVSQEMAPLTHSLLLASLDHLSSPLWPIRNCALQLFGALVPRVVGQRKRHPEDTGCSCYHLCYEELYFKARPLVSALLERLEAGTQLVPVLTLLSNLCVGLLTIVDRSLEGVFHKFVGGTQQLMCSKSHDVRRLAAKANAWFCSPSQISNLIRTRVWKIVTFINDRSVQNEIKTENDLNGFLLNTQFLKERFDHEKEGVSALKEQALRVDESIQELKSVRDASNVSFINRTILCELTGYDDTMPGLKQISEIVGVVEARKSFPHLSVGVFHWARVRVRQVIENCSLNESLSVVKACLLECEVCEVQRACLGGLRARVVRPEFESVLGGVLNVLFEFVRNNGKELDTGLEVVSLAVVRYSLEGLKLDVTGIVELVPEARSSIVCGLAAGGHCAIESAIALVTGASQSSDEDTRRNAAQGLALLPPNPALWHSTVALLQDESTSVRLAASCIVQRLSSAPRASNPYIALTYMLRHAATLLPAEEAMRCLWEHLECTPTEISSLDTSESLLSPYDSPCPNPYLEKTKTLDLACDTLLRLVSDRTLAKRLLEVLVLPKINLLRAHCLRFLSFGGEHALNSGLVCGGDWYVVSKKLGYQCRIINSISNDPILDKDHDMFHFRFQSYLQQLVIK